MSIEPQSFDVLERESARLTGTVLDDQGTAIAAADLTALTLTLYDKKTENIVNSRDGQNVLNQNNVTVGSDGALVWTIQVADNVLVNSSDLNETHIALFEWSYSGGGKSGKQEIELVVRSLKKVP